MMCRTLLMVEEELHWFAEKEAAALATQGQLSTTALAMSYGARFALEKLQQRLQVEGCGCEHNPSSSQPCIKP